MIKSLTPGEQATIIGIGLALLTAVSGGIWRSASLRGDVNMRWKRRVDFAVARLAELIVNELATLRSEVDELLPSPGSFDPATVVEDPSSLSDRAAHIAKLGRIRQRMEDDLSKARAVGPFIMAALIVLWLGVLVGTVDYAEIERSSGLRDVALVLSGVGFVGLCCAAAIHVRFQLRLSAGEIAAGTAPEGGPADG
jgi:hypothetical protein